MKRVNYGPAFDQNHLAKESHDRTLALAGSRVLPPMSGRAFGYTGGVVHNMNIKHNMHYSGKSYSEEAEIYDAIHGTDIARSAPALHSLAKQDAQDQVSIGKKAVAGVYAAKAIDRGVSKEDVSVKLNLAKEDVDEEFGIGNPAVAGVFAAKAIGRGVSTKNVSVQNSSIRKAVLDEFGKKPAAGVYAKVAIARGLVPGAATKNSEQRERNVARLADLLESHYNEWVKNARLFVNKDLTSSRLEHQTELADDEDTLPSFSSFSSSSTSLSVIHPLMPPASSSLSLSSSSTSSHCRIFAPPTEPAPSIPGSWAKASIESIHDSNSKHAIKRAAAEHMCKLFRAEVKLANLPIGTVVFGLYGCFSDGSLMQAKLTTDRGIVREAFKKAQPASAHEDTAGISLILLEKKQSETPGTAVLKITKTGLEGKLFAVFCYLV
jgi:hypothetical protein